MPNCPNCDDVEMVPINSGDDRECPACGYTEPHSK